MARVNRWAERHAPNSNEPVLQFIDKYNPAKQQMVTKCTETWYSFKGSELILIKPSHVCLTGEQQNLMSLLKKEANISKVMEDSDTDLSSKLSKAGVCEFLVQHAFIRTLHYHST